MRKKPGHTGEARQVQKRGRTVLPRAAAGRTPEGGRKGGRLVGWYGRDVSSGTSAGQWEGAAQAVDCTVCSNT